LSQQGLFTVKVDNNIQKELTVIHGH